MQIKPLMWDDYYNGTNKTIEYKVVIGTDEYLKGNLRSISVSGGLCSEDVFSLGNVICRALNISIIPKETAIAKMSNVDLYIRYNGVNGPTDWLPKGKFFIDIRQKANNNLNLECYDSVLRMEKPFIQDVIIPDFPMLMTDAMTVICTRLGLIFENPTAISNTLYIEYPNELTMREVAGYIASANGGNFIISDEGKLRLVVPTLSTSIETVSHRFFDEINDVWTVSRVTMYYDDENYYTAGDDTADELIIHNIWATQAMCNNVLTLLGGYLHKPFTCSGAYINPAAELGDTVTIGSFTGIIFTASIKFGASVVWDINSPGESALEHEYPYQGSYARAIKQKVALNTPYYGVTISRQDGLKITKTDGSAEAIFNTDVLAMRALEEGVMKNKLYFDPTLGKYVFDGTLSATMIEALEAQFDITISNTTITQVLAAETGYIAQLTVDELLTDRKVQNYLNNDTSPIEYQHMFGKYYRMIYASTDGTQTVQATSRGQSLFWKDSDKEAVTLEVTDYPVMVYVYDEPAIFQISFSIGNSVEMIFGQGDGVLENSSKAFIRKTTTGLELIYYRSNTGEERKISLDDIGTNISNLIIENRTDDPANPAVGQIWLRTDLA